MSAIVTAKKKMTAPISERIKKKPFGSKIQNHPLDNRLNDEFRRKFKCWSFLFIFSSFFCFVYLNFRLILFRYQRQYYIKRPMLALPVTSLSDRSKVVKFGCDATASTTSIMPSFPRRQHAKDRVTRSFIFLIILLKEMAPAVLEEFLLIRGCLSSWLMSVEEKASKFRSRFLWTRKKVPWILVKTSCTDIHIHVHRHRRLPAGSLLKGLPSNFKMTNCETHR